MEYNLQGLLIIITILGKYALDILDKNIYLNLG